MASKKSVIVKDIEDFVAKNGGKYEDYYVGITNNLERRLIEGSELFAEHIKSGRYKTNSPLFYGEAESRDIAFEIEVGFQKKGMLKYNPGGRGTEDSKIIYCFKQDPDFQLLNERKKERMKYLMNYRTYSR
jgi:hypothetical protein